MSSRELTVSSARARGIECHVMCGGEGDALHIVVQKTNEEGGSVARGTERPLIIEQTSFEIFDASTLQIPTNSHSVTALRRMLCRILASTSDKESRSQCHRPWRELGRESREQSRGRGRPDEVCY